MCLLDTVEKIKALKKTRSYIDSEIVELSKPDLTDRKLIPEIYEWFKEILSERDPAPNIESPYQRKKFLFIILSLYNPGFFSDERMTIGLRKNLAGCIGDISETIISENCNDVLFIYQHYKDFSEDIDEIFTEIKARLGKECYI